ncbi:hypothetical protein HC891_17610 [Candidatus Gracilibacteria bacterium]|nr:hypothetical protein [Candidatus Gracilibacteria bacterium]
MLVATMLRGLAFSALSATKTDPAMVVLVYALPLAAIAGGTWMLVRGQPVALPHKVQARIDEGAFGDVTLNDDGSWSAALYLGEDFEGQQYSIAVRAIDRAGRTSIITRTVTIDLPIPPHVRTRSSAGLAQSAGSATSTSPSTVVPPTAPRRPATAAASTAQPGQLVVARSATTACCLASALSRFRP